jgi:ABC-type transport system substrate-binding protein
MITLAVFVLTMVACTGSTSPSVTATVLPTSTAPSSPAATFAQPTATVPVPTPAGLTHGGVLRLAIKEAPPHQDVHQSVSNVLATWGAGLAYSRLFKYQSGPGVPLPSRIPQCDLCKSWKQTGPLEFEFQIRDDVFWPDTFPLNGRRLTAGDIVYSFHRTMTPGFPNRQLLSNIQEVAAFNDERMRIRLYAPDAEFFEKLADGHLTVVAPEAVHVNGRLYNGPTLGTGPWILQEVTPGGELFDANPDYYGDDKPYLDALNIQFIAQDSTRAAGVRAGILDVDESTLAEVESATAKFPDIQSLTVVRPDTGIEVALNTSRSPLDSLAVRQAVFLAWDLETTAEQAWDGQLTPSVGLNVPSVNWIAPFQERYSKMFGDASVANALLSNSGLTTADRLTIIVGEFGETQDNDRFISTARSLADALNGMGIATEVLPVPTRLFADNVWLRGDYDIFVGAPPQVSSLSGQLLGIYHSNGPWNTTKYSSAKLDALIEQQAVETSFEARGELLLQIQDEIMAGAHRFYVSTGKNHWMWQPGVQDFWPNTTGASADFLTHVWLSGQ